MITGGTSGIGKESALLFAGQNCNLVITARRENRLKQLQESIQEKYNVKVKYGCFDVRDYEATKSFIDSLTVPIDILINNAGLALGTDPVDKVKQEDWDQMIDTNVKGLLTVSRFVIPGMKERNAGHIINVGSIAGHEAYAGGVVYSATKHAVLAITKAMKKDLHGTNIRVSMVSPGLVETEFSNVRFKGDDERADQVYKGMKPLTGRDIAEVIVFIANRPAHVNILDSVIFPTAQSSSEMVHRDE